MPDERAVTAAVFLRRAVAFFTAHGITVEKVLTDNGSRYRSHAFDAAGARRGPAPVHPPPPPPDQRQGRALQNRTLGVEFAYARPWTSETQRSDHLQRWLIHYNYHRAHTATGNQPPATLAPTTVTNVMMQNT